MKKIALFVGLLLCCAVAEAQKETQSYNYQRGVEALTERNDKKESYEFFTKELQDNPKNGYAWAWMAAIGLADEEYGGAMQCANAALKYLPKKDKEYRSYVYSTMARINLALGDTNRAIQNYGDAIKQNPTDEDYYNYRAQHYFNRGNYAMAEKDYRQLLKMDEASVIGLMGLGRNASAQERNEEALSYYSRVIKLYPNYQSGYSYRGGQYLQMGRYREAVDDFVYALTLGHDDYSLAMLGLCADSAYEITTGKMKAMCLKNPNEEYWHYQLALLYEDKGQYEEAVDCFKKALAINNDADNNYRLAVCYNMLGCNDVAVNYISNAIAMADNVGYLYTGRAMCKEELGDYEGALSDFAKAIELDPEEYGYFGYYRRGWMRFFMEDYAGAIDDLTLSIALAPEYSESYYTRGRIYDKQGKTQLARKDYLKVVELNSDTNYYAEAMPFSLLALGRTSEAEAALQVFLRHGGSLYDGACFYSLKGDKELALDYFRRALEKGYRDFNHIRRDPGLDGIRETSAFRSMVKEYEAKAEEYIKRVKEETGEYVEETAEIPFTRENGVCKVKCKINGLPLHFIFDSGCSDVTISMVEASFMLKNDYLERRDFGGSQNYVDANGNVSEGTVINLRSVDLGGIELTNVRASVVRNQKAPLLLGQSVLSKMGKIEIDNDRNVIKVTYSKKNK